MDDEPRKPNDTEPSYLDNVVKDIAHWRSRQPNVINLAVGWLGGGLSWLVDQLVPTSAIEGALQSFTWVAKSTTTAAGDGNPNNLQDCDSNCNSVINFHIVGAVAEGGAVGWVGALALPVDIPMVITGSLRLIWQIGAEYGFTMDNDRERAFVFSVLSAAGSSTQAEKVVALTTASQLMVLLSKTTFKAIGAKAAVNRLSLEGGVVAVRGLARQLGVTITKRKALEAIPVIGAFVGAATNGKFMYDVGEAAQNLYRERWMRERGILIDDRN